jgi:hypothetical protein
MGAAFGLALAYLQNPFAGALIYGLSLAGVVGLQIASALKPREAILPPDIAEIKTRLSNLEIKSGVRDRRLIPK